MRFKIKTSSLYLLCFLEIILAEDQLCSVYRNNIQCQDIASKNCSGKVECEANNGNDDTGGSCNGIRIHLYQTDEDYCGWCSDTCVKTKNENDDCLQNSQNGRVSVCQ